MPLPTVDHVESHGAEQDRPDQAEGLASILRSYNGLMEKLQRSHELLSAEVVSLKEQLAGQDAQLQRSRRLAALGEMAAGMAHELRNPLGAIGLYAEMLAEDLGSGDAAWVADQRERLGDLAMKIVQSVRGMDAVVGDVLTFSREMHPKIRPCGMRRLMERVLAGQAHVLTSEKIELVVDITPDDSSNDLAGRLDEDLMLQVLTNLVRNAVEAMSGVKAGRRRLILRARKEDGWLVLEVRDSGPGIPAESMERIFNPFYTTRNTGTGLGLAIVHRIMDAHGGTIAVHNDQGAVFALHLPQVEATAATGLPEIGSLSGKDRRWVETRQGVNT